MSPFEGKTIIFGVSKFYHINKMFEAELKNLGFKTIDISIIPHDLKYSPLQRIHKFIRQRLMKQEEMFFGFKSSQREIEQKLDKVQQADFVLLTRPDFYPESFLKKLRAKKGKMIAYQWDGLHKFPRIYNYFELFDRFFVYENPDLRTAPHSLPMTNFYPVAHTKEELYDPQYESNIFYSGSYSLLRLLPLSIIKQRLEALGLIFKYSLYYRREKLLQHNLKTSNRAIPYLENLKYICNTDVVLDLLSPQQTGLSFRAFEAIGFDKKLITNNRSVSAYDFYKPENIMIWNDQQTESISDFLNAPFTPYPEKIKEKYSFTNWIKYALDEGEYIPLTFPEQAD